MAAIGHDLLIDGEAVGDTLHAFDLLELGGTDLRHWRYRDRFGGLLTLLPPNQPALRWVSTVIDPNDKVETYEDLRRANCEGVVFKDMVAPTTTGGLKPSGQVGVVLGRVLLQREEFHFIEHMIDGMLDRRVRPNALGPLGFVNMKHCLGREITGFAANRLPRAFSAGA